MVVLGKENAEPFRSELDRLGMDADYLEKEGRIRENLTLHTKNRPETRISFAGLPVTDALFDEVEPLLLPEAGAVVTFTGRLGDGMSVEKAKAFLFCLKEKGFRIVLDSKSFSLQDVLEIKPWLIKPNGEEIAEYLGGAIESLEEACDKAAVFREGGVENVMVSLGEKGAVLLSGEGAVMAIPPSIHPRSTIGAGDSTIAGFLAAASENKSPSECLRTAVAYGTAACLTEGTLPPRKEDVPEISSQIRLIF